MNDAVTVAAYALALAAADQHLHMKGLRRAEHGSGSDYYLVPSDAEVPDDPELDLERDDLIRLEVSGIEDDDVQSLRERVRVKVRQVGERRHPVPGLAGVAGFRTAQVIFRAVTK